MSAAEQAHQSAKTKMRRNNSYAGCMLVCNSSWILKKSLSAMINQTRAFDEIIIVDDNSSDNTVRIAEKLLAKSRIPYKIFIKTKRDIAISRNIAFRNAESNYVCYIDSDVVINEDWLENMSKAVDRRNEDAVVVHDMLNVSDKKSKYFYEPSIWLINKDVTKDYYVGGCSFASTIIRKNLLEKVKGFNSYSKTGEDADLLFRLRKHKHNIRFYTVPVTTSWHYDPPGIMNHIRKSYKWGKGAALVAIRYKTPLAVKKAYIITFPPITIPLYFFYCLYNIYRQKAHKHFNFNFLEAIFTSALFTFSSIAFGLGALRNSVYLIKKFPEIKDDFPGTYKLHKQGGYK